MRADQERRFGDGLPDSRFAGDKAVAQPIPATEHVIASAAKAGFALQAHGWTIVALMAGTILTPLFLISIMTFLGRKLTDDLKFIMIASTAAFGVSTYVVYGWWILRMWRVVRDELRTLSPTSATVLSVIPIVHFVGMFFAYWGLARCLNAEARVRNAPHLRASEGMALAACFCYIIGTIFGWIPFIGCVFSPVGLTGLLLWMIGIVKMSDIGDKLLAMNAPIR
jgi:hypothetical protein